MQSKGHTKQGKLRVVYPFSGMVYGKTRPKGVAFRAPERLRCGVAEAQPRNNSTMARDALEESDRFGFLARAQPYLWLNRGAEEE
jgi:hypothetical protein